MKAPDFAKMSESEFAANFAALLSRIIADPVKNFVENPLFMDFTPTPAQGVALKCVFGQQLDPDTRHLIHMETTDVDGNFALHEVYMTEVELYEFMTSAEYLPEYQTQRNRINLIVGRRGGKTTCAAILAIFCAIKMNWKPYLKKTPAATVAILSHSKEFSEEVLELIKQLIEDSPVLARLIDRTKKHTQNTFNLTIPFIEMVKGEKKIVYSRVVIKVGAASKKTIRGKAICALLCDEIAFWNLDETSAERDEDILRAARPALLQFGDHGLLIKLSSPGIKQGVLYDEYNKRNELPANYITLKAPSWVWNTILMAKDFLTEYQVDPAGFDCEYRANFVDSISNFILPEFVDLCTQRGVKFLTPEAKTKDMMYAAALDAAFKSDRFAFTLLGWDGHKLKQYIVKTWQGSRKSPVKSSEVATYIQSVLKEYKLSRVYADQYAFQPLKEIFDQHNITLEETTFTNTFKKKIYFSLKNHIHNQTLDLLDYDIQTNEIKQLQVEQTTTGTIRIGHPPGGKDDCADVIAIASYLLSEKANAMGIADTAEIATGSGYGVATDNNGRAFHSPSADMVSDMMGTEYTDNLADFRLNPETQKWERIPEGDDDDDTDNDGGSEVGFL